MKAVFEIFVSDDHRGGTHATLDGELICCNGFHNDYDMLFRFSSKSQSMQVEVDTDVLRAVMERRKNR